MNTVLEILPQTITNLKGFREALPYSARRISGRYGKLGIRASLTFNQMPQLARSRVISIVDSAGLPPAVFLTSSALTK